MTKLLTVIFLVFQCQAAVGQGPVSMVVHRSGLDVMGESAFERFEITHDGLARWETSGFGDSAIPGCPRLGGRFSRRIGRQAAIDLVRAAHAAVLSQPRRNGPRAADRRGIRSTLWVDFEGDILSAEAREVTPAYTSLMAKIDALETSLRPRSIVAMRASRSGSKLTVTFRLLGNEPVRLLIPDDPMEVFRSKWAKLSYEKAPSRAKEVELTPKAPSVKIVLFAKGENKERLPTLRYSTALVRHHAKGDALEGDLVPPELSLCAPVEAGR